MATFTTGGFKTHDDYMTPQYAWKNIQQYIPKDKIIWEAFVGDGKSGEYLRELGCKKVIQEDLDFFNDETLPEYDLIVSNPPFSKSKEVVTRLRELNKPFILIMPSSKLNTRYMRQYNNTGLQIIVPKNRIHFDKKIDGKTPKGWKNSCNFDCFYYCWKLNLQNDLTTLESDSDDDE